MSRCALEDGLFGGANSLQAQSYFQLLNPLVFLLFAIGFLSLFAVNRGMKAAAWIGASYAFGATFCAIVSR